MDSKNLTQRQRLQNQFTLIKQDVTAADRDFCSKEYGYTKMTISRYVNGVIADNDTAVKILTFLKNRIAKRDKAVAA